MTIIELRNKRAKAFEAAKAFLEAHADENGILSEEDVATYNDMEKGIKKYDEAIGRMERLEAMDAKLSKPVSEPITEKPAKDIKDKKQGRASDAYKEAFWNQARAKNGVSYEVRNALQEGVDTEGGYLVPDEFEDTLVQALVSDNIVHEHAHVFTTNSGSHKIPVVTSKGSASWVDEEGAIPEDDDAFGQQSIGAHKVGTAIKISEELLNDSVFDLPSYIAKEFARRIGT
ncbi:MAG: phage major capsid protein, partial [Clostridia bacterium]|nr:phage major capsid protein [Clostridia bacterium]